MDSALYIYTETSSSPLCYKEESIMNVSTLREMPRPNQEIPGGCSVEVGPLRFKVWHKSPTYLCLLAGQDPSALFEFREGANLTLEYFDGNSSLPSERLNTAVRKIKRNVGERLKGQYLVDLEILKSYH